MSKFTKATHIPAPHRPLDAKGLDHYNRIMSELTQDLRERVAMQTLAVEAAELLLQLETAAEELRRSSPVDHSGRVNSWVKVQDSAHKRLMSIYTKLRVIPHIEKASMAALAARESTGFTVPTDLSAYR